jgi:hypothetical protein
LLGRSYCTDLYSPYNKEEGTNFEADCGHEFQGLLECLLLQVGRTGAEVQLLFGTFFEVLSNKGWSYNNTDLAQLFRKIIVGFLGAVRGILLLENVMLLLIYFLEANKISLSLWISPHLGFP